MIPSILGHITREGPATARKLLTEVAWQGVLRNDRIRGHFAKICGDDPGRRKIAFIATARRLSTVTAAMLKMGECWREGCGVLRGWCDGMGECIDSLDDAVMDT